jgi:hypothetical protein
VDLQARTIGLAAKGFSFVDGVVVLPDDRVLVSELSRFRMLALDFQHGSLDWKLEGLPGMPDGIARFDGKIWQALLHKRTWPITLVHRFPRLKRLLLPLIRRWLEPPKGCGMLVLDERNLKPIYCGMHDGSRIHHVATITPSERGIFLPSFHEGNRGLHWIPDPTS